MPQSHPTHYSPFGSCIQELQYAYAVEGDTSKYRFGFSFAELGKSSVNNQEQDNELGEYYAFEYRIHDVRLGRFLSVDPLSMEYPWNSSYAFAENIVIDGIDLEGGEWLSANARVYVDNGIIYAWVANLHAPLKHYFISENSYLVGGAHYTNDLGSIDFQKSTVDAPANSNPTLPKVPSTMPQKAVIKESTTLSPKIDPKSGQATTQTNALRKDGLVDRRYKVRTLLTSSTLTNNKITKVNTLITIVQIGLETYVDEKLKSEVKALNWELTLLNQCAEYFNIQIANNLVPSEYCNDVDLSTIMNVMLTGSMPDGYVANTEDKGQITKNEKLKKLYDLGWKFIKDAKMDPASKLEASMAPIKLIIEKLDNQTSKDACNIIIPKPINKTPVRVSDD